MIPFLPLYVRMPHAFPWSMFWKAQELMVISLLLSQFCTMHMCIGWMAYLSCVVHLDLGDLPVAGLCVVLQPGLSGKKATNSEHPHTRQEGEEMALSANIRPGQHRQHFPCVRPPHRLIVQGVLLRLPGPRFQFPVRSDLPSHFCDEAKSPFLHHVWCVGEGLKPHWQNFFGVYSAKDNLFLKRKLRWYFDVVTALMVKATGKAYWSTGSCWVKIYNVTNYSRRTHQ